MYKTTHIDQQESRIIIAKLRKVSEVKPGLTFMHERIRKTKTTAEANFYSLLDSQQLPIVRVRSNDGLVSWDNNLPELLSS